MALRQRSNRALILSLSAVVLAAVASVGGASVGGWNRGEYSASVTGSTEGGEALRASEISSLSLIHNAFASGGEDQYGGTPIGKYTELGVRDGVYNNGQSALWDLHIIDYYRFFGPPQRARGYRPEQPIKFSHITHVQQNKMECQYCHHTVNKAAYAAIPEVETCMGCHKVVSSAALKLRSDQATTDAEKARLAAGAVEVEKLEGYWARQEPIPWVKVHVQPDYVHFNHKRHVAAGVSCQECHGQVPNMEVVERVSSMKMGWCLDCHRTRGASIDCYTCHY